MQVEPSKSSCAGGRLKRDSNWALSMLRKWKGQASNATLMSVARKANRKAGSWACGGLSLAGPGVPGAPPGVCYFWTGPRDE